MSYEYSLSFQEDFLTPIKSLNGSYSRLASTTSNCCIATQLIALPKPVTNSKVAIT